MVGLFNKGSGKINERAFTCQRDNLTIRGTEYRPKGDCLPIAIVSHGFMAFQDTVRQYAKAMAEMGYVSYCFDFCGGCVIKGKSDGSTTEMSVLTEVKDLEAVIRYARGREYSNPEEILLMGCSQGGFVSAIAASKLNGIISKLVMFYPALCIPDDARAGKMMFAKFDPGNIPDIIRCGPMKLGKCYVRDVIGMDPYQEIQDFSGDILIVHGTKDKIEDKEAHGKKSLKEKNDKGDDDNDSTPSAGGDPGEFTDDLPKDTKTINCSTTDPESGWFRKGEHKNVFAYAIETACDKNGWILGYTINPGNLHDSRTFKGLYDKINGIGIETLVADAGYKTPAIAKLLIDDGIKPLLPYKRPMTKEGFFKKYEYAYDEYYDCYICPNNKVLTYCTTNRDGYREYKSCGASCSECPYLSQCTESREHIKVVTRHIWEPYMEMCEDIRQTLGMKDLYALRKETIERIFGTAKENHGFRYTQMYGKARMEMKVGLTYACMNLKKLAKIKAKRGLLEKRDFFRNSVLDAIYFIKEKWLWCTRTRAALSTV